MNHHKRFASVSELVAFSEKGTFDVMGSGLDWAGGYHLPEARRRVLTNEACPAHAVAKAQALLDKIDGNLTGRVKPEWVPSVCGAYPMVPDALAGFPDSMRRLQMIEADTAPVKVYIEAAVSAGVSHEEMYNRSAAITALIMRLSETRAVELHLYSAWCLYKHGRDNMFWDVKLDVNPVGLAQAMNTMGSVCFTRPVNFALCDAIYRENTGQRISPIENFMWAFEGGNRPERLREYFGLNKSDILMVRGYLDDAHLFARDPAEWVNAQLDKYRHVEDAA